MEGARVTDFLGKGTTCCLRGMEDDIVSAAKELVEMFDLTSDCTKETVSTL